MEQFEKLFKHWECDFWIYSHDVCIYIFIYTYLYIRPFSVDSCINMIRIFLMSSYLRILMYLFHMCACCCMMLQPPGGAVVMLGDSWEEVSISNVCLIEQKLFRTCSWKYHWVVATQIFVYFHPENWGRFPFWLIYFKGLKAPTGLVWIPGIPFWKRLLLRGSSRIQTTGPQTTNPNH